MQYTQYELSDEHIRGLFHGAHPSLDIARKDHFDTWLAEHDRRVKSEAWDERDRMDPVIIGVAKNPYRTED